MYQTRDQADPSLNSTRIIAVYSDRAGGHRQLPVVELLRCHPLIY